MSTRPITLRYIKQIPKLLFKYKYLLVSGLFVVYMMFFDQYKLLVVVSLVSTVNKMEAEKLNFEKLIVQAKEDKVDIEKNYEKFAREKYFMSREDEDVFVIEKQKLKKK